MVAVTKGAVIMRFVKIGIIGLVCLGMTVLALATPAFSPKHEGYAGH
jgi:hypothetical protein